jgi:zinc/manganese transport system ATP-binding protein
VGYLPQRRALDRATGLRGVDLVRLGLDGSRWGIPLPPPLSARRRAEQRRIAEVVEMVGATEYACRAIGELSGGEQQRLLIAQALAGGPKLLILDEPLDGLDLPSQASVAALVRRVASTEQVAVLLVAHDVNPLIPYLDRVVYLGSGRALAGAVDDVITSRTLSALYRAPIEVLRTSDGRLVVVGLPEAPHHHGPRHR